MAFDFPNTPVNGQEFTPSGGPTYVFQSPRWVVKSVSQIATADTRNRIVNGAMQISQEAGFDTNVTASGAYIADQWQQGFSTSGTPRSLIISTEPEGKFFRFNSWSVVDASVAATDYCQIVQKIEGIRIADFLWGTASAKPVVLRFTARVLTVTSLVIGVSLGNGVGRSFVKNVTLNNTWQDFVIAIPGDTAGTWATTTAMGVLLSFAVMAGSNSIAAENAWVATNSFAAAGVGNAMAVTSTAIDLKNVGLYLDPNNTGLPPPWQMPDEAQELRACQRYYEKVSQIVSSTSLYQGGHWMIQKRITPAVSTTFDGGTGGIFVAVGGVLGTAYYQSAQHSSVNTGTVVGNARM